MQTAQLQNLFSQNGLILLKMNSGLFMNRLITIGHSGFTNTNRGLIGENVGLNVILMSNVILSLMSILIVSMENGLIPEVNWEVGLIIFVFTIKKVPCTYIPASFYFLRQFEYNIVIKKCIKTQWNELLKFIDLQLCMVIFFQNLHSLYPHCKICLVN